MEFLCGAQASKGSFEKVCRFCYGTEDEFPGDAPDGDHFPEKALVSPCACRGSSRWVHYGCLHTWEMNKFGMEHQKPFRCGICHGPYVGRVALVLVRSLVAEAERRYGVESIPARCLRDELTSVLCSTGELDLAEELAKKQVDAWMVAGDMPNLITAVNNLSTALTLQHKIPQAERWARQAVEICEKHFGPVAMPTLNTLNDLGTLLYSCQKYTEAEAVYRQAYLGCQESADCRINTLSCANNLGSVLRRCGQLEEAEKYLREAQEGRQKTLGEHHPDTLSSVNNLAALLCQKEDYEAAAPLYERALQGYEATCGETDPATLALMANCARVHKQLNDFDKAETIYNRVASLREQMHGKDDPRTLAVHHDIGRLLRKANKLDEALTVLMRVLKRRERVLGYHHEETVRVVNDVGCVLMDQGKTVEAEPYYHRARDSQQSVGRGSERLPSMTASIGFHELGLRGRVDTMDVLEEEPMPMPNADGTPKCCAVQ